MDKNWSAAGTKISGRFFYVTFRDSKPTIDDLITVAHASPENSPWLTGMVQTADLM